MWLPLTEVLSVETICMGVWGYTNESASKYRKTLQNNSDDDNEKYD